MIFSLSEFLIYYLHSVCSLLNVLVKHSEVVKMIMCTLLSVISCPSLTVSLPLMVDRPNNTFNSTATFSCQTGYNLNGSSQLTCQADMNYDGMIPNCTCESPWKQYVTDH